MKKMIQDANAENTVVLQSKPQDENDNNLISNRKTQQLKIIDRKY